jgi:hypothetical protein
MDDTKTITQLRECVIIAGMSVKGMTRLVILRSGNIAKAINKRLLGFEGCTNIKRTMIPTSITI